MRCQEIKADAIASVEDYLKNLERNCKDIEYANFNRDVRNLIDTAMEKYMQRARLYDSKVVSKF